MSDVHTTHSCTPTNLLRCTCLQTSSFSTRNSCCIGRLSLAASLSSLFHMTRFHVTHNSIYTTTKKTHIQSIQIKISKRQQQQKQQQQTTYPVDAVPIDDSRPLQKWNCATIHTDLQSTRVSLIWHHWSYDSNCP